MIKSIKRGYSADKDSKLQELRKKQADKDMDFPFPMPQDPLGLEKFNWPDYPTTVQENAVREKEWADFRERCNAENNDLNERAAQLEKIAEDARNKRTEAMFAAQRNGKIFLPFPWYAAAGARKLQYLIEDKDNGVQYRLLSTRERVADVMKKMKHGKISGLLQKNW
ncbi:hypothetical protein [Paraflavitalea speifideaquila]|uniref:hypothetical protein n=1 Tax=Paraflavitalea speifideaquila TaxID=3076558 RepID=UPI0028E68067|nr:hypothetical protein [Paraflavitalea speifideiaquila]